MNGVAGEAPIRPGDVFAAVVGQERAVSQLRAAAAAPVHAYLLVGPPGAGARAAAAAFAAALLCPRGGCGRCRDCRLALAGEHPDARTFVPEGAYLRLRDAEEIAGLAARSPVEGRRKVLVLTDFHRVREVAPALLKTVEEPPPSTVFVILADTVVPELVTIASRCGRVDLPALDPAMVSAALSAEGVAPDRAEAAARASRGDLERGRVLAVDDGLAARQRAWEDLPDRLDGTGAAVAVAVEEILALIEGAAAPLRDGQAAEVAELEARVAATGERGSGRARVDSAHRQALRRHRSDELRFGLATLAGRYAGGLTDGGAGASVAAIEAIQAAAEALERNPNEALLLQALLSRLPEPSLGAAPPDPIAGR